MKVGIIGLGSIGQRHVRCLQQLGIKDIVAFRTKKGATKKLPADLVDIKEVFTESDFYAEDLDGVIIANPTSLHIKSVKQTLEHELPIFVEKPIANSVKQLEEINQYDKSKIMVGFCLRFHEVAKAIKQFISEKKLGEIIKASLYVGQYLPTWHPHTDYRTEYYSRKELGGGALRTLSHEIDLMIHFFGKPIELSAAIDKLSDLEIDVDDNAIILSRMANGSLIRVELDFLNPTSSRKGVIFGSKGKLEYSFSELTVNFTDYSNNNEVVYHNLELDSNQMYVDQMRDFIELIRNKKSVQCTFDDSVIIMNIIKLAEESSKKKSWIKVD
ncbi:MAG: Gfo/Idh/MocA family protein [Candidatus Heimdallarchaeota archaeon]